MLDFLASDLAIGIIALVVFGFMVLFAETDRLFSGIAAFVVFILTFNWLRDGVVWSWVAENAFMLLAYIVIYLAIGVAYTTFWKWRNYVVANRNTSAFDYWRTKNPDDDPSEYYKDPHRFAMHPKNHLYRLSNWTVLWPWSLFWTLLNDPITWLWNTIYKAMGEIWLNIAVNADKDR